MSFLHIMLLGISSCLPLEDSYRQKLLGYLEMAENAYRRTSLNNGLFSLASSTGLVAKVFERDNEVVVAFKGMTLMLMGHPFGRSAETDKRFVGMLFSCCRGDPECLDAKKQQLAVAPYFADAALMLGQVRELFPGRRVVLTGHSLGGAIAAKVGLELGIEAYAFGAPGDRYFLGMLGIRDDKRLVHHLGMCNDPVYTGRCSGWDSACRMHRYAVETKCHSGTAHCIGPSWPLSIVNHTVGQLKWFLKGATSRQLLDECSEKDCEAGSGAHYE